MLDELRQHIIDDWREARIGDATWPRRARCFGPHRE